MLSDGIVNGAIGTVKLIHKNMQQYNLPQYIAIKFDNNKVGIQHQRQQPILPKMQPNWVLLEPHKSQAIQRRTKTHIRYQYPLKLSFASTIHKVQGATLPAVCVDLKHVQSPGQAYVALSQAQTLKNLYIANYNKKTIFTNPRINPALQAMPQIPQTTLTPLKTFNTSEPQHKYFIIAHLNIQSFFKHHKDLQVQQDLLYASILVLSETWLDQQTPTITLTLPGNHFYII